MIIKDMNLGMYAKYDWFKAKGQLVCIAPDGWF